MTRIPPSRFRPLAAVGLLIAGFALSGCFNPFSPRIAPVLGTSKPAPVPSSAPGVLRLFEWCYNQQAIAEYREIFTDDYRFLFSPLDSSGAEWRGTPWTREDELISTTALFVGGSATEPAATSIRLSLDRNFFVYPDPAYTQWDPVGRWHKHIQTTVTLLIGTDDGSSFEITGSASFYMVRGDSAVIPEELRLRAFGADPNRWYIRRWDDETAQPDNAALLAAPAPAARLLGDRWVVPAGAVRGPRVLAGQPYQAASWGAIKAYFRGPTATTAGRLARDR